MRLRLLGASNEVGRSGVFLQGRKTFLLDYGIKINHDVDFPLELPVLPHAVVVSHAHLDHSGALPLVFRQGYPEIYMTPPTLNLTEMLLHDTIKVAKRRHKPQPYNPSSIKKIKKETKLISYHTEHEIGDSKIKLYDAGHIPGAAGVLVQDELNVFYTGDFKLEETRLHKPAEIPKEPVDVLVIESTYGGRDHPKRKAIEKEFVDACREVLDKGGHVVVPVFAVGRAQEILEVLYANDIEYPVYMDGMATKASEIILDFPNYVRDYKELYNSLLETHWIHSRNQRKRALQSPSIIIATAGMLQGGPVLHYLLNIVDDINSAVFLTGYQKEDTRGRELLENKIIDIDGYSLDFRKHWVEYFDFSAHASREGLRTMVKKTDPRLVVLNHGDLDQIRAFSQWLDDEDIPYLIPEKGVEYDLSEYL